MLLHDVNITSAGLCDFDSRTQKFDGKIAEMDAVTFTHRYASAQSQDSKQDTEMVPPVMMVFQILSRRQGLNDCVLRDSAGTD